LGQQKSSGFQTQYRSGRKWDLASIRFEPQVKKSCSFLYNWEKTKKKIRENREFFDKIS